jgi:hypothetical protein
MLLNEFEKANGDPIQLSKTFIKMGPVLKIYINYINNYGNSITTYEHYLKNPVFSNFCNVIISIFFLFKNGKIKSPK